MREDRVKECVRENDVHFTVLLGLISVPNTQQWEWEKDKRRSERKLTKVFTILTETSNINIYASLIFFVSFYFMQIDNWWIIGNYIFCIFRKIIVIFNEESKVSLTEMNSILLTFFRIIIWFLDEIRIVLVPIATAKWQSIIQISGEGLKFTFLFYITKYETYLMYENDIFAKKLMTLKNSRSKNVNVLFMYSYTENSLTILWPWQGWPWWVKKAYITTK